MIEPQSTRRIQRTGVCLCALCGLRSSKVTTMKPRRKPKPRPKTRAALAAREKEVWEELAAAWCKLPDEVLMQPGACGPEWSVKDVMNHIAAWQEAALRIITDFIKGRKATLGHSTNTFNALRQVEDKGRPLAASKRRLNRARRELLALIAALPEARCLDPNDRVGGWVKFTTYAHYGEHIYELTEFRMRIVDG